MSFSKRLEAERELFSRLSIQEMEEIAAASQALVDKAMAMAKANASALTPDVGASHRASGEDGESSDASNPTSTGTDVNRFGAGDVPLNRDRGKARRTSILVAVSPSPTAGVDDVVAGDLAEESTAPTVTDLRDAQGEEPAPRETP